MEQEEVLGGRPWWRCLVPPPALSSGGILSGESILGEILCGEIELRWPPLRQNRARATSMEHVGSSVEQRPWSRDDRGVE
jgi:hypothetical protein